MVSLIRQLQKMKTEALLNYLLTKNTFLKIVHYSVGLKMEKKNTIHNVVSSCCKIKFLVKYGGPFGYLFFFFLKKNFFLKNVYFCLYGHQYSDLSKLHLLEFRLSLKFSLILHDNDTPIKLGFTIEKHNQSSLIH